MPEFQFYTITQCGKSVFSHIQSKELQRVLDMTEEGKVYEFTYPITKVNATAKSLLLFFVAEIAHPP